MSNFERTTSWQQIQQGVKEIERLLGRNEYNLVMVKARQVLEYMVRCMAERACLVEGDLADTIDQLFEGRLISRTTKDNYHTIRILGNKAVHEGDNTPYDADKAYKLLTQEVYAFASEFQGRNPAGTGGGQRTSQGSRTSAGPRSSSGSRPSGRRSSGPRPSSGSRQGSSRTGGRSSYQSPPRQGAGRRKKRRRVSPLFYLWRLLIPILVIVLLVVIIKVVFPGKDKKPDATTTAPTVTTAATEPSPTLPPEPSTVPETEPVAAVYRIKGTGVNVRSAPSTDANSTVLVQLSNGTEVEYVKRYNEDWAVINYDGREAYVSNQFLERTETVAETPEPAGSGQQ
ncbi:MAG: SH3 domain-containing protein [Clostridium sp.]|nr:SH3 domain-containing protein [Clostridium sp.]